MNTYVRPKALFEILQKVEHLGFDGFVQRGHRLVQHHQARDSARVPARY
jgi:hypothetical protein